DMHTHIFPPKIAEKATGAIGAFYGIPMSRRGFADDLVASGAPVGVVKYLVCSTATTPMQVTAINSYIASETAKHPEFVGYGSLHPAFDDIPAEVDRMISLGLRGIKLHPDFQKFAIDDREAFAIYEAAEGRLPILFHTGDRRYQYSNPERVVRVLREFPNLTVICAHLGGYSEWDSALGLKKYLGNPNIYIDTSSSARLTDPETAVKIIRKHGADRVFWGTDYPMWDHKSELEIFMKLPLTDDEKEKILFKNAEAFLSRF
ncbi:MAG: amidohydrolase, partial [Clostridia bacterium]|nr:amidohydrolase [Clostridia bacterium]